MRLKFLVLLSVTFFSISTNGQSFNTNELDFKGRIKSVIEKSVNYPNSWREFDFDNLHRLIEKKYFREHNLVQTEIWDYAETDSMLVINKQIENGTRIENFTEKLFYDSSKRIKRKEVFSKSGSIIPEIVFTNFVFNGNDIIQYNRILINNHDTTTVELYEKEYREDKLTIIVRKTDSKSLNSFTQTSKFDKNGNLKSEVIDYNNPEVVLADVITWSRSRRDKYRVDYKYDKQGNWIKKYAVTWLKKHKIEERIINYE